MLNKDQLVKFLRKQGHTQSKADEYAEKFEDAYSPENSFIENTFTFLRKEGFTTQKAIDQVLKWCSGPISWTELEEDIPVFYKFFRKEGKTTAVSFEYVETIIKPRGRVDFVKFEGVYKFLRKEGFTTQKALDQVLKWVLDSTLSWSEIEEDIPTFYKFFRKEGQTTAKSFEYVETISKPRGRVDYKKFEGVYKFLKKEGHTTQKALDQVMKWVLDSTISWAELEEDIPKFYKFFRKEGQTAAKSFECVERLTAPEGRVDFAQFESTYKESRKSGKQASVSIDAAFAALSL